VEAVVEPELRGRVEAADDVVEAARSVSKAGDESPRLR
jgi:hypothetical protein